jgi:hypothetical protein
VRVVHRHAELLAQSWRERSGVSEELLKTMHQIRDIISRNSARKPRGAVRAPEERVRREPRVEARRPEEEAAAGGRCAGRRSSPARGARRARLQARRSRRAEEPSRRRGPAPSRTCRRRRGAQPRRPGAS